MTSTRQVLQRALQLAAGAAAFGVTFEATARLEDRVRYDMPILAPSHGSEFDLLVRDSLGLHGRPGARYLKWALNSLGTRGPEVGLTPGFDTLRVVTTGASEAFGHGESAGREFPRQLEAVLRAQIAAGEFGDWRSAEVLNTAFIGMLLPTTTQDVRRRVRRFGPHIVVLYPSSVQYLGNDLPLAATPLMGPEPALGLSAVLSPRSLIRLREELKRHVPLVWRQEFWRAEVRRETAARGAGWRFAAIPQARLEAFERDLRAFVGAVRSIGAEPVLATHANCFVGQAAVDSSLLTAWERFYPRAEGQVILAFDSAAADVVRRVGSDSAAPVADVRGALRGCASCFEDYSHFSDEGAARVARTVAEAVRASSRRAGWQ